MVRENTSPAAGAAASGGSLRRSLAGAAVNIDLMDEFFAHSGLDRSDVLPSSAACASSTTPRLFRPTPQDEDDKSKFMMSGGPAGWHTQPRRPAVTVQQRMVHALRFIREAQGGRDALIQLWVPTTGASGRQVLTTAGQPFSLGSGSPRLVNYRRVSTAFQFLADERSREAVGLPGRVFLEKLPEWSPDVRYFNKNEYPRVRYAKNLDVRGTVAIPVFERDGKNCLGVVEIVTTAPRINYGSDLESFRNALYAVGLRSAEVSSGSNIKMTGDRNYQVALPEILCVLRVVCQAHNLPLAQTWISCIQQGKSGSRHSDEKYLDCISTVDSACFVQDPNMLQFHRCCSEHHLFRGQGVAGKALLTNQPCFSPDITALSKIEYPLSHHAKLFNLRAAVAIRLRSIHTRKTDFVLEFFLPPSCSGSEEQKLKLNSLSATIQKISRGLRVVTPEELQQEAFLKMNRTTPVSEKFFSACSSTRVSVNPASWTTNTLIAQQKGVNILPCFSAPHGGFNLSTLGQSAMDVPFSIFKQNSAQFSTNYNSSFSGKPSLSNAERFEEKKHTETEKIVGIQDIKKSFAGSLKEAAKSLGVCPTTLKRICRQHGISRCPSRKIKKVGHTLKKLQVVIDSVHGLERSVKLSSLYENITMANLPDNSSTFSSFEQSDDHMESLASSEEQQEGIIKSNSSPSNSHSSSSCSETSSSSFEHPSADNKPHNPPDEVVRINLPDEVVRIKATDGHDTYIYRLEPGWGFQEVLQRTMNRFHIDDPSYLDLKYLDDDSEWVLLRCDADLEEAIDVFKKSVSRYIRISVNTVVPSAISSLNSTGFS